MKAFLFCAFFASSAWITSAQAPQPPYALLQHATLAGSGNRITATQIPVVTASGVTVYVNATVQFDVDGSGNLTVSAGFPQVTPAPATLTSNFKAGRYVFAGRTYIVSGPGVADGGATMWTLSAVDNYEEIDSATWYVGPVTSNPSYEMVKAAKIASTVYSYGLAGGRNDFIVSKFRRGSLIGAVQTGDAITIVSFSNVTQNLLYSSPIHQLTLIRAPGQ